MDPFENGGFYYLLACLQYSRNILPCNILQHFKKNFMWFSGLAKPFLVLFGHYLSCISIFALHCASRRHAENIFDEPGRMCIDRYLGMLLHWDMLHCCDKRIRCIIMTGKELRVFRMHDRQCDPILTDRWLMVRHGAPIPPSPHLF